MLVIPIFNQSVYEWGLEYIRVIQYSENAFLTFLMRGFSFLSDPIAYFIILPILFWCIDEKKGLKIGMLVLFSTSINSSIKNILQVPRPYITDPSVALDTTDGFSTPSGHAQASATFWPYAVYVFGKNLRQIHANGKPYYGRIAVSFLLAIGMPLLIGFSRVYLGVHYPSDILLGWTVGFLFSVGAILFTPKLTLVFNKLRRIVKILMLAIVVIYLNWLGPDDTSMAAIFFGLGIGYIFLQEKGGFTAKRGTFFQKIIRSLLGLAVIGFLYAGLELIFPKEYSQHYELFRFIRYALVGFFISFIMPKIFIALKIGFATGSET